MTQSRLPVHSRPTRRQMLKSAALGSVAAVAAPYVKGVYAAGSLSLGVWDHWVPGANNTLTKLCNEWGAKNNCEVRIDYITSQGEKDKLTAAAEAQAGTGHDIMSHRDWNVRIHQNVLEPMDDVVAQLTGAPAQQAPAARDHRALGVGQRGEDPAADRAPGLLAAPAALGIADQGGERLRAHLSQPARLPAAPRRHPCNPASHVVDSSGYAHASITTGQATDKKSRIRCADAVAAVISCARRRPSCRRCAHVSSSSSGI